MEDIEILEPPEELRGPSTFERARRFAEQRIIESFGLPPDMLSGEPKGEIESMPIVPEGMKDGV